MSTALSLFPTRVPIVRADGTMTPEFARALLSLANRAADVINDAGSSGNDTANDGGLQAASLADALRDLPAPQVCDSVLEPLPHNSTSNQAWPVGSIFISAVATNPAILLGYGTWIAFGTGSALFGYSSGDPDFGTLEGTGGAKTKAISAHAGTAVADHADHTHNFTSNISSTTGTFGAGAGTAVTSVSGDPGVTAGSNSTLTHSVTQPNNHTNLNVLPPFIVVNFWKRTA